MQLLRLTRLVFRFATQPLRTQIFHTMSDKELATPELVKRALIKRIPDHGRVSMVSLYHGKRVRHAIKSCFSQKKTKRFKRIHTMKKHYYSQILDKRLRVRMSNKAYRCIKKAGSFDNYILITPPKQLDSKIGEYYRTLMLRKINDPEYRIPYVLGSGTKNYIHKYQRYRWIQDNEKIVIPKDFKKQLFATQRQFGSTVEELNQEDYQKYLQVEKLKKLWGKELDTSHPLLLEIEGKLNVGLDEEELKIMQERAERYEREYLEHPKDRQLRRQGHEHDLKEGEKEHLKVKEAFLKFQMGIQAGDAEEAQAAQKSEKSKKTDKAEKKEKEKKEKKEKKENASK